MKRFLLIIGIVSVLVSCKGSISGFYPEPDNLLSKEEMVDILTELAIIESAYQMKYVQVTRYSKVLQQDADSIFRAFKADRHTFEESMTYYGYHQEELIEIYQYVKANLEQRQADLPPAPEDEGGYMDGDSSGERTGEHDFSNLENGIKTEEDM